MASFRLKDKNGLGWDVSRMKVNLINEGECKLECWIRKGMAFCLERRRGRGGVARRSISLVWMCGRMGLLRDREFLDIFCK